MEQNRLLPLLPSSAIYIAIRSPQKIILLLDFVNGFTRFRYQLIFLNKGTLQLTFIYTISF